MHLSRKVTSTVLKTAPTLPVQKMHHETITLWLQERTCISWEFVEREPKRIYWLEWYTDKIVLPLPPL